ncbi:hypothetical protein [Burkholderia anthina]|uniref:Uncharacterized protein n=1 Tax=Burkholderia anthina TaxID=179879 RepID=A0A6P2G2W9_9BURK|nr:hypothetical protein [Burkholderia anthina]MBM2767079.1 hypothetical protein [Burkholderia anthina]VVU47709.1 hypothetical protein BAN20980_00401 [Burkholderia anthina]
MAKRNLTEDYRHGAKRANELLIQWTDRCCKDSAFCVRFPDELRSELSRVAGDVRLGLEDGIAIYLRSILEDMPPILGKWDLVEDLEDPEALYGIE